MNELEKIRIHSEALAQSLTKTDAERWLADNGILPLMFHAEPDVQNAAIGAMERLMETLIHRNIAYQDTPSWPDVCSAITEAHTKSIKRLFEANNRNWQRIWCVLLRLLDTEIVRSAKTINTYLAIVEQGFRAEDVVIRGDAFLCWRVMLELFIRHGEITSPKRIRLICIPLKSSRSKTEAIAINKFNIWWPLLCAVHEYIDQHSDLIESFFYYCFGPFGKGKEPLVSYLDCKLKDLASPGKQYTTVRNKALAALGLFLGAKSDAFQRLVKAAEIEAPATMRLCTRDVFVKEAKMIFGSCFEAIPLLLEWGASGVEVGQEFWQKVLERVTAIDQKELFKFVTTHLGVFIQLMKKQPWDDAMPILAEIITSLATNNAFFNENLATDDLVTKQNTILLFLSEKINFSERQITEIVSHTFDPEKFMPMGISSMKAAGIIAEHITLLQGALAMTFKDVQQQKLVLSSIWSYIARGMAEHVKRNPMMPIDNVFDLLLLPIEKHGQFETAKITIGWTNLLSASPRTKALSNRLAGAIKQSLSGRELEVDLDAILEYFNPLLRLTEAKFDQQEAPTLVLDLLAYVVKQASLKAPVDFTHFNLLASLHAAFLRNLSNEGFFLVCAHVQAVFSEAAKRKEKHWKSFLDAARPAVTERVKQPNFNLIVGGLKQMDRIHLHSILRVVGSKSKNDRIAAVMRMCNEPATPPPPSSKKREGEEEFVVIPKVWKMCPERLTEHQRERMKERSGDIPALYNDMSQSQESSQAIKAWTPGKVVVAGDQSHDTFVFGESSEASTQRQADLGDGGDGNALAEEIVEELRTSPDEVEPKKKRRSTSLEKKEEASPDSEAEKSGKKKKGSRVMTELERLTIDTVEGKELQKTLNLEEGKRRRRLSAEKKKTFEVPKPRLRKKKKEEEDVKPPQATTQDEIIEDSQPLDNPSVIVERIKRRSLSDDKKKTPPPSPKKPELPTIEEVKRETRNSPRKSNSPVKTPEKPKSPAKSAEKVKTPEKSPRKEAQSVDVHPDADTELITDSFGDFLNSQPAPPPPVAATAPEPRRSPRKAEVKSPTKESGSPKCASPTPAAPLAASPKRRSSDEAAEVRRSPRVANNASPVKTSPTKESVSQVLDFDEEQMQQLSYESSPPSESQNLEENLPPAQSPNLEETLPPFDQSMTIISSPEVANDSERAAEFLNKTADISPIGADKMARSKPLSEEQPSTSKTSPPSVKATLKPGAQFDSPKSAPISRGAHIMNMLFRNSTPNPPAKRPPIESEIQKLDDTKFPKPEFFIFSKTLPPATASPSASILKRKQPDESSDEIESPAYKRKRVSFHDPPVSLTKEYIRHEEELRSPSLRSPASRCLLMLHAAQKASPPGLKYTLKTRKPKFEGRIDLLKMKAAVAEAMEAVDEMNPLDTTADMPSLTTNDGATASNSSQESFSFDLDAVVAKFSLDEVLEKYFAKKTPFNTKVVRLITKELSAQMEADEKLKFSVLDRLSEKHSADFLDHAMQENSAKVVLEKIQLEQILGYVLQSAGEQQEVKVEVLKRFETLFSSDAEQRVLTEDEILTFILNVLPEHLNHAQIQEVLTYMLAQRQRDEIFDILVAQMKRLL